MNLSHIDRGPISSSIHALFLRDRNSFLSCRPSWAWIPNSLGPLTLWFQSFIRRPTGRTQAHGGWIHPKLRPRGLMLPLSMRCPPQLSHNPNADHVGQLLGQQVVIGSNPLRGWVWYYNFKDHVNPDCHIFFHWEGRGESFMPHFSLGSHV